MRKCLNNILLLIISLLLCAYLAEFLLGFYIVKSVPRYPLPPHALQKHTTVDYNVTYRYNNYSLRGADFRPVVLYDAVLLGDSFFFGQGVGEGKTLGYRLWEKGWQVLNVSEIATNHIDYFHKLNVMAAEGLRSRNIIIGLCIGNDFTDIEDLDLRKALTYNYREHFLAYDGRSFLTLERLCYQILRKWQQIADWLTNSISGQRRETVVVHEFEHRRKFDEDWLRYFTSNRPELIKAMAGSREKPLSEERLSETEYLQKIQLAEESLKKTVEILNAIPPRVPTARVYVVLIPGPHYVWGFRSPRYDKYIQRMKGMLAPSVEVIDLHGRTTSEMHYLYDGHWNEQGHSFMADVLSGYLLTP
ncbi:MAG: SGNH/GDSL hydrolase family protein [Syntrophus sp. (in: bacteria)]